MYGATVGRARGHRQGCASRRLFASGVALLASLVGLAAIASPALANAPQPTSINVDSEVASGNAVTITISGTWTWDTRVPNGPQQDCNDSRVGVGYAVDWGDNTANPLPGPNNTTVYVGDAADNWVHSVSESPWSLTSSSGGANMTFDGPFKPSSSTVTENMTGETADAVANGFGPQGIPDGVTSASPGQNGTYDWFSNCGPTAQSTLYGQTIGNTDPSNPQQGYPNGQWGPISHTYTTPGPYTICPVMYDPHGNKVGDAQTQANQLTAGGQNANDDNSVQGNDNTSACPLTVTVPPPSPGFKIVKEQKIGSGKFTADALNGTVGELVHYAIVVENTGNTSLTFSDFTDAHCDPGTISGGPGASSIPAGGWTMYTCSHVLTAADGRHGRLTNVATDTGTPPGGSPITSASNKVLVHVARKPQVKAKRISRKPKVSAGFTG